MAMIPVKVPPHGKVLVIWAWIGNVSHKGVDILLVLLHPPRVEMANVGSCQDVVAVMEMVVIVVRIAKVDMRISSSIGCGGNDTSPTTYKVSEEPARH
jgi:hypothetical protein